MFKHNALLIETRAQLGPGQRIRVPLCALNAATGHLWREEALELGEWWVNSFRAYGMRATPDPASGDYVVELEQLP